LDLSGSSLVAGKAVSVTFAGGRLTSDASVLVLVEVERRLGIAERLAHWIKDPKSPERVHPCPAHCIDDRLEITFGSDGGRLTPHYGKRLLRPLAPPRLQPVRNTTLTSVDAERDRCERCVALDRKREDGPTGWLQHVGRTTPPRG
jgi:hypothetical protein